MAGFNNFASLNLTLNAINNIINAGTITSGAGLTMTAGNSIVNALPGVSAVSPIIQAINNVNLNATNIVNAGLIASSAANINVAAQLASAQVLQNLNISSTSGTWQALAGVINIGNLYPGSSEHSHDAAYDNNGRFQ